MRVIMMASFGQVLSSMEKQFGIKSEEAAWIFSGIIRGGVKYYFADFVR